MKINYKFFLLLLICVSYVTYCSATGIFWGYLALKAFDVVQKHSRRIANNQNPFPYPPRPHAAVAATASSLTILGPIIGLVPSIAVPLQMFAHKNRLAIAGGGLLRGGLDARFNGSANARFNGSANARVPLTIGAHLPDLTDARVPLTIGARFNGSANASLPDLTDARVPITIGARFNGSTNASLPDLSGARIPLIIGAHFNGSTNASLPDLPDARLPQFTIDARLPAPTDSPIRIDARLPDGNMEPGIEIETVRRSFDKDFENKEEKHEISEKIVRNRR